MRSNVGRRIARPLKKQRGVNSYLPKRQILYRVHHGKLRHSSEKHRSPSLNKVASATNSGSCRAPNRVR